MKAVVEQFVVKTEFKMARGRRKSREGYDRTSEQRISESHLRERNFECVQMT